MSAGALLYLLLLVYRRAGKVHAEAAEEGLVDIREDDGGVYFIAAEAGKLLHGELRMRIGCGADGERNEKLIGVQARIVASEVDGLQLLDRSNGFCGDELLLVRNAGVCLQDIHNRGSGGTEKISGLSGDDGTVLHFNCSSGKTGFFCTLLGFYGCRTVHGRDVCLLEQKLLLVKLFLSGKALADIDGARVVAADDLLLGGPAAGIVIADGKAGHVDAHVGGRLVRAFVHNALEDLLENREDFDIAVVIDGRLPVCLQVERIDHVDIRKICRRCLIGKVDRVLERQIPDRKGFKLRIAGFYTALMLLINLRQAGCHLAGAGAGGSDDNELAGGLNVLVAPIAVAAENQRNVGGISLNHIVKIAADAKLFEALAEVICSGLPGIFGDHDAADIEAAVLEGFLQTESVIVVGDAEIAANLVLFDGICTDDNNDFRLVLQLLQHLELDVRGKAGKNPGCVVVIEQLAAEFQIELPEMGHAFLDVRGLELQIALRIKTDFC